MPTTFAPETAEQVVEAVAWAVSEETPLEILGQGSKRGLGRPLQTEHSLDLSRLSGVSLYEPAELVLSAKAGTPMAELESLLSENSQMFAFEPPDLGPLLGGAAGQGTIGGAVSCNLAGPRRIKAGALRDHFLGVHSVSGRGELFKSGGRVVKNVTGYDLCKLLAGAYGTLSVLTEVTLKVLPRPEKTRTVLLLGLDDAQALDAMTRAMTSMHEVASAAHLPAGIAARSTVDYVAQSGGAVTAIRVEGPGPSVEHRCRSLRTELSDLGESEELHSSNSDALWRELRDVDVFAAQPELAVWRVSVPPQAGPALVEGLRAALPAPEALQRFYDWGGGLIWLALPAEEDAGAAALRALIDGPQGVGGHATLVRATPTLRAALPVFQPQEAGAAALSRRIKENFDPRGLLNPGRMYAGV